MEFEWEEEPQERKGELKIGSFSLSLLRRDIRLWGLALYKKWVWIVLVPPLALPQPVWDLPRPQWRARQKRWPRQPRAWPDS